MWDVTENLKVEKKCLINCDRLQPLKRVVDALNQFSYILQKMKVIFLYKFS